MVNKINLSDCCLGIIWYQTWLFVSPCDDVFPTSVHVTKREFQTHSRQNVLVYINIHDITLLFSWLELSVYMAADFTVTKTTQKNMMHSKYINIRIMLRLQEMQNKKAMMSQGNHAVPHVIWNFRIITIPSEQINTSLPPWANFSVIIFKKFKPVWSWYNKVTDRQIDRQDEWLTSYYSITMLCRASCGKRHKVS